MSDKRIRLAWCSPYGRASDIGAFTRNLVPHFNDSHAGHEFSTTMFVNDNGPRYPANIPLVGLPDNPALSELMGNYDVSLYNLGNNIENHANIIKLMRQAPGVGILHDFSYHHMFAWLCFEQYKSRQLYARTMYDWYGKAGLDVAVSSGVVTSGPSLYRPWDSDHVTNFPLFEPFAGLASALIVHSDFAEAEVRKKFDGPIARLFLPWDQKPILPPDEIARWAKRTLDRQNCHFVIFGHIVRSKCIDAVIQALALSDILRGEATLTIAGFTGDHGYAAELEGLVRQLGLEDIVTFEYGVSDQRLLALKAQADVFVNLRWPNTEGASGSLVEQLNTARPVIVYNSGCYAEIPRDGAAHVERHGGLPALARLMERLATHPAERVTIGQGGLQWVRSRGGADYVRQMKDFLIAAMPDLKRRGKLIAPARAALGWRVSDVAVEDRQWFDKLGRARRAFNAMERDTAVNSPEPFLEWPREELTRFAAHVLLDASPDRHKTHKLEQILAGLDRWTLYREVSRLRRCLERAERAERVKDGVVPRGDDERVESLLFWRIAECLSPQRQAGLLHLGILGRSITPEESLSWAVQLGGEMSFHDAASNFLRSAEYESLFSDDYLEPLLVWVDDELAIQESTRAGRQPAVLEPGQVVRLAKSANEGEAYLCGAWYDREDDGIWSSSRNTRLRFLLPDTMEDDLALRVRIFVPGRRGRSSRVEIFDGSQSAVIVEAPHFALQEIDVPLSMANRAPNGETIVRLSVNKEYRPSLEEEGSRDERWLGIKLVELELIIVSRKISAAAPDPVEANGSPAAPEARRLSARDEHGFIARAGRKFMGG